MRTRFTYLLATAVLLSSCDPISTAIQTLKAAAELAQEETLIEEHKPTTETLKNGTIKSHRADGTLASEITYRDNVKHGLTRNYSMNGKKLLSEVVYEDGRISGVAKNYYPQGQISNEFTYVNDTLQGDSRWYYENGKLYQLTPFKNGLKDGTQKTYNKQGNLISEVPYYKDEAALGLKEYNSSGELKEVPYIIIEPVDRRSIDQTYVLRIYMSDRNPKARFYMGKLTQGKYLGDDLTWYPSTGGITELSYSVPPGYYLKEKLNIIASSVTKAGNPLLTQKSYTLAVENH